MLRYTISKADKDLIGEVTLFPAKKISNKVLVFRVIQNVNVDTRSLLVSDEEALFKNIPKFKKEIGKGESAAALRHLRAFFNFFKGDWVISGSDKIKNHPIKAIVKLLQKEGVNIRYAERDGLPPFKLIGKNFRGNTVLGVDSSISSKLVAAGLILSPTISDSVIQEMKENIINSTYIEMTLKALKYLGINTGWDMKDTLIETKFKDGSELILEADWSCASYWYEAAALAQDCNIRIHGLNADSSQDDVIAKDLFTQFGVKTRYTTDGVTLTKGTRTIKKFEYNFKECSDLVPTFAVVCVIQGVPFRMAGIDLLRFKCNDRIKSLQHELGKIGATITIEKDGEKEVLCYNGKNKKTNLKHVDISTFEDHRMAMAFAPIAITGLPVIMENPILTSKSYPAFWDDFRRVGFSVDQSL